MEDLIKDGKMPEEASSLSEVPEPTVSFRMTSDRGIYEVRSKEADAALVEISGYDLQMIFNMQYLNSMEDIENALDGLKTLFRELIMEQIMERKKTLENA